MYSTTLTVVPTARTRLERRFDPDSIRHIKATATTDLTVGGPTIAASAFEAGLVDECCLFVHPVVVGGGKPALPRRVHIGLDLQAERRFAGGAVYLGYRIQA